MLNSSVVLCALLAFSEEPVAPPPTQRPGQQAPPPTAGAAAGATDGTPASAEPAPASTPTVPADVLRVIEAHAHEIRNCYTAVVGTPAPDAPALGLEFTVGANGRVALSSLAVHGAEDGRLIACVAGSVGRWEFAARTAPVQVSHAIDVHASVPAAATSSVPAAGRVAIAPPPVSSGAKPSAGIGGWSPSRPGIRKNLGYPSPPEKGEIPPQFMERTRRGGTKRGVGLMATGYSVLAGSYVLSALTAWVAGGQGDSGYGWLYLPVVGPWVAVGTVGPGVLVFSAIPQTVGLSLAIAGTVRHRRAKRAARRASAGNRRAQLTGLSGGLAPHGNGGHVSVSLAF